MNMMQRTNSQRCSTSLWKQTPFSLNNKKGYEHEIRKFLGQENDGRAVFVSARPIEDGKISIGLFLYTKNQPKGQRVEYFDEAIVENYDDAEKYARWSWKFNSKFFDIL